MAYRVHQISMSHQSLGNRVTLQAMSYEDWTQINNIWNGDEVVLMNPQAEPGDVIAHYRVQHIFIDPREHQATLYLIPACMESC